MAATIATLAAKLVLDNRAFLAGFRQSIGASKGFAASIGAGMASAVSSIGATIAASLSLAAAMGKVSESMVSIDRQAKLADRLGLTNEAMQRMAVIAKTGNVDVEVLAKAMLTMGRNIGTGGKSLDERFFDVADAIAAIKDPAERSRKAMAIFGKEGNELINMLAGGSARMRASTEVIDRFGLSMSRMDAAKVERTNDAWTRMGIILGGLTDKFSAGIAPGIESEIEHMIAKIESLGTTLRNLGFGWDSATAAMKNYRILENSLLYGTLGGLFGVGNKPPDLGPIPGKSTGMQTPFDFPESGKKSREVNPGAMERNSIEAVRAVQKAGGDPISALHTEMQKAVRALIRIEEHVDPLRGGGQVLVAATI